MEKYILSIDQGTTSSRAIVFDHNGDIIGLAQSEFPQIFPQPGWVEHNPQDILDTELDSIKQAIENAGIEASDIDSIGITNQRETTILWDKETGEPIYNAIVWQCRRTHEYASNLAENKDIDEMIYNKTGLRIDAYFSATKIKWILDNVEGARQKANEGKILFGTVDTYLLWNLTGGHVHATDYTNASRTLLFNIHTLKWDEELLKLFDIPSSILPEVHPSSYEYGYTDASIMESRIPICGIAGDQQSSLFGQLCVNEGDVKNTYGTGCFLLMNTGKNAVKSSHGLLTTLAASLDEHPSYVLEGSVFIGGASIQWLRMGAKMIDKSYESEQCAYNCKDSGGVYVVPAFAGLGAPYWDSEATGIITGITRGTTKDQIVRATLEGIAYQVYDVLEAMENDLQMDITTLCVDGGASKNNYLMQFQADILNAEVKRPKIVEVTALGAAYLAGLKTGYFKSIDDISNNKEIERTFKCEINEESRKKYLDGWHLAVRKAMLH